jgi:hypothetical protein
LNIGAPKFVKQTVLRLKEQIGLDTIIVGILNTPLSSTDIQTKKINKDILKLNNTTEEMDLAVIIEYFIL